MLTQLRTRDIKNAMYGSTQLSAVYKGATPIWTATVEPDPTLSLQLTNSYYKQSSSQPGGCSSGIRYDLEFEGIHNLNDPGRMFTCQCWNEAHGNWTPANPDAYWTADTFTQPGVPFSFPCDWLIYCTALGTPDRKQGRMRFRSSAGKVGDWVEAPPVTPDNGLVLTRAYFKYNNSSSGCTRGTSRYDLRVLGTHTYNDPGRAYNIQYDLNNGFGWQGSESNWISDVYTTPGVPFDVWGAPLCTNTSTPEFNTWCRMRFKLSDGTVTDWSYYMAAKATDTIPLEILEESEIPDG